MHLFCIDWIILSFFLIYKDILTWLELPVDNLSLLSRRRSDSPQDASNEEQLASGQSIFHRFMTPLNGIAYSSSSVGVKVSLCH